MVNTSFCHSAMGWVSHETPGGDSEPLPCQRAAELSHFLKLK